MKIRNTFTSALWLISFCFCISSYAITVDKLIVFGDSLSDTGNLYSLTMKAHKVIPLVPVIPKNPPYYEGRFTNGPVWIDDLSLALNVPIKDYAYGGSWAESILDSKLTVPFGLGMQVDYYLMTNMTDFHKSRHLYVIWSGANDYVQGRPDPEYSTSNTVETIQKQIDWLVYYGAKNIFIMNLPDLSLAPEVRKKGPDFMSQISSLVKLHNKKLGEMIAKEKATHKDANILYYDITSDFNEIYTHPSDYNLKNVTDACYDGGFYFRDLSSNKEIMAAKEANIDILNSPSLKAAYVTSALALAGTQSCGNPDEYVFWDVIHPTRIIHHLISLQAMTYLQKHNIYGQA